MGIFYLDVRMVSKAKQSAVAKAAYVSNEKLYSERDEENKDYRNRSVKPESFILAPEHAPEWVYNRQDLWNEVEKIEKNYNSQLLREIVVALPIELSDEEQMKMLKEYVSENFVSDGMVADVHIHRDQKQNPHAHILLTVRPFNEDGTWWEFKSKKEYLVDENNEFLLDSKGKKRSRKIDLTGWNSKVKLMQWRENFSEKINEYYKKNNINESVSHLSYEEQGKEILGKHRLTRNEYHVEKQAERKAVEEGREYEPVTHYGEVNAVINSYNEEIKSIESKIVSLEEYKASKSKIDVNEFENIRKQAKLNSSDYDAIRYVRDRSKSKYVDFSVARKTMYSLEFWKRSMERKERSLSREKNILESALKHYESGSNELYKMGFDKNQFISQYNSRVLDLQEQFKSLSSEFEKYQEAFGYTEQVLDFQKDLLRKEFIYLYPQYEDIAQIDSPEVNNIMYNSVSQYKQHQIINDTISEFEQSELYKTDEEHIFRFEISKAVLDYRNHSVQYFGLKKQVDQKNISYKQVMNIHENEVQTSDESKEKIYNAAVEYLTTKNEFDHISKTYEQTKNTLYNSLIELYGIEQESVISQLPDRIKVLVLERYLEERSVGELKDDLTEVKWTIRDKGLDRQWENGDTFTPFESTPPRGAAIGNMLTDLIEQAKVNEGKHDDLDAKRKRARRGRKRLTKEEMLERGSQ